MEWSPHVVVASIVERERRFLLVEETVDGELRLNQPAGHWEQHETLVEAARREALEETRWEVEPIALLGLYHFDPPGLGYGFLRVAFVSQAIRERAELELDAGILRAVWLTRDEIAASRARHRSPMVLRCIDDYLAGRRYPLDLIAHL
ncbi:NUDIX hydrolase [Fontimonas sp. SYSU GA230001]|uniref:NUDIX hydrolase n=1 Tax=Fontimonas sp. SYSU GA230001 TaxID=3142450 RepID=UPI0032B4A62E